MENLQADSDSRTHCMGDRSDLILHLDEIKCLFVTEEVQCRMSSQIVLMHKCKKKKEKERKGMKKKKIEDKNVQTRAHKNA